ncbi:MAG: chromosomal replication initiator protein DnaA [Peptococcaceae bacterium]|nr:chromosomal replication initiator protein DnaA [Peptococcaceae bacterium]
MVPNELLGLWTHVLQSLQKNINPQSFENWIKPLKPVAHHDNTVLFEAPDHFSRDWLSERYAPLIKQCFKDLLNYEVGVKFLLPGEFPQVEKPLYSSVEKGEEVFPNLNPKYTFNNWVIGNNNRFAHAAAVAVSEAPARAYNPLFIYGGVGLGKTHLMHAIGHAIRDRYPQLKVAYVTTEKFTNELINAIKDDKTPHFRSKYRSIDILLIDDIQFLAKKESTQEEFFHTFNSLYEARRQIVISCDRTPKEIPTLEERLRSRFEWGLITDIQPPDLETRVAILRQKAQMEGVSVPDETLLYIADRIQSNIRELEGAFIRVTAFANLTKEEITPDLAAEVLKDIIPAKKRRPINCALIQEVVASYFRLKVDDLKAKKRTRTIAYPRQIAMYLTRELTDLSLPRIGTEFGGRDHTTVLHAYEKIAKEIQVDQSLQEIVNELITRIKKQ